MSVLLPFVDVGQTGNNIYWLMTKNDLTVRDIQKKWFDSIIEWVELEFLRLRRRTKND